MRPRPKVYLSGPITNGDRDHNFNQAAEAQVRLMNAGLAVLNPMLSMKLPGAWDIPHDVWIENDLPWVAESDVILRLPGQSLGADTEVAHAAELEIPVFFSIEAVVDSYGERPK